MKLKTLILTFLFLLLAMAGCNPDDEAALTADEPATDMPVDENPDETISTPALADAPTPEGNVADCPAASAGTHLLVDAARGFCFHYPENYDVFQGEDGGYTLYVRSLLNTEAPLASFSFTPAGGQTLADLVAQQLVAFGLPESDIYDVMLDGEPAIMLDNLPGQDINRRLLVLNNDLLMDMMVARIGAEYGDVGEQAETLYETITGSFRFIPPVAGAPLQAGPECPAEAAGQNLYTNAEDGYCLLLPDGYAVDDSLTTDGGTETAIYVGSLMDVAHPHLFITVTDAGGQTLEEITEARVAELEAALPGFNVTWSFGHMLDGIPANQFDQVPGQDLSRQVVMVYNGRLYTLTFIPDDETAGDVYTEMQALYDLVMDSFSFTQSTTNAETPESNSGSDPLKLARMFIDQAKFTVPEGWQVVPYDPAGISSLYIQCDYFRICPHL